MMKRWSLGAGVGVASSVLRLTRRSCATSTPGKVKVHITDKDGTTYARQLESGLNLMEAIRDDYECPVDMQGICGGMCKCSTCHLYVDPKWSGKVRELFPLCDAESDILDGAVEVKPESRLCCQIVLTPDLDGLEVSVPQMTRDMRFHRPTRR